MAPAFELAARWEARIGTAAWAAWKTSGFLAVDDPARNQKSRVHWGFVEELARIDAELGPWPDVRVPTRIVHGTRDDIVDISVSRTWSVDRRHIKLVEVNDGHELTLSIPRILDEANDFFRDFMND
jgi:pimeloyl-ACP methyl ester carboxylesterase